ncbi:MAG: hypothetical protein II196_09375 [Spirochaetales bacterium]|nr:hypothetical protein [Spirochaetales bacterium]
MKNLQVRILMYILGLFILTIGISISVKSDLGVSPLSSLPYTMTCVWGIEMGKATIIFHCLLVLLQAMLLGRKFKPINLLQVLAGIIFGYFTTLCNYLISFIPSPNNIVDQIMMALISTVFVAVGTFFYLPTNIMPLAGEGIVDTIAAVTKIEFSNIKIMFDSFLVLVSVIICFIALHNLGSVGIGTLIAALLVGAEIGYLTKLFGKWRDKIISE